jgi:YbbR domain-containing protein
MTNWLSKEQYLKIFSLILAIAIWFMAIDQEDRAVNTRLQDFKAERTVVVTPQVRDLPDGLVLVSAIPQVRLTLRVSGASAILGKAGAENSVGAYISLLGLSSGLHIVDIQVESQDISITSVKAEPSQAVVELQRLAREERPLTPGFIGSSWDGINLKDVKVEPKTVVIEGPEEAVRSVTCGMILLNPHEEEDYKEETLSIHLVDDKGMEVRGVNVSPASARIIIPGRVREEEYKGLKETHIGENIEEEVYN